MPNEPTAPIAHNPETMLEDALLGRVRGLIADQVTFERGGVPARIVRIGRTDHVSERFPGACVRPGSLAAADWSGWPDLVWVDLALGGSRQPDRWADALAWGAGPDALVVAIEVERVDSRVLGRWLDRGLGGWPGRDGIRAMRSRFDRLCEVSVVSPDRELRTHAILARVPRRAGERAGARPGGLCGARAAG